MHIQRRLRTFYTANAASSGRLRRGRTWTAVATVFALVVALIGISVPAEAATVGTAGLFVPLQARLADSRVGAGVPKAKFAAMASQTIPVAGKAGLPAEGISAVQITVTTLDPTVAGQMAASSSDGVLAGIMRYDAYSTTSNSAVVMVSAAGKINVRTTTDTNILIDIQGYYTSGNGVTAAGGYAPVTNTRIADTNNGVGLPKATLKGATTTKIQVTGKAGVPAGAKAVFVNFQVNNTNTVPGWISTDGTTATSLNFDGSPWTSIGAIVPLAADGSIGVYLYRDNIINLLVDVQGYFTAGDANTSAGVFTPAVDKVYDTRSSTHVAPGATVTVPLGTVTGLPTSAQGLSAITTNLTVVEAGTAGGFVRAWASGTTEPTAGTLTYAKGPAGTVTNNLATIPVGADNAIKLHNVSADTVDYILDLQGFYRTEPAPKLNISCPASYGNGAWISALPVAPIACQVVAIGGTGKSLAISVDGVDAAPLPAGTSSTTVAVEVSPTAGSHSIEAKVLTTNGDIQTQSQYDLSFGDWVQAPLAGYPASGLVTENLTPSLTVNSDGDRLPPDALIRYVVTLNPDGVSQPLAMSDWMTGTFQVPAGVLTDGNPYYWSALVKGTSGGRNDIETVQSPTWSFVASAAGPVDPSNTIVDAVSGTPALEDMQARADKGETPLTFDEPQSGGGGLSSAGASINVVCTGNLQYAHISTTLKNRGIRSVDNKIDIKCKGYGASSVQVRVRGIISFAAANSTTDTKNKRFELRASTSETKTLTVNGEKIEFTCPSSGTAGAGLGKGFWATTFTYQPSVGRYVGTVGTQTSTIFKDLR